MIAALLPLLPLLQAVPLHIDAAKNTISDRICDFQKLIPTEAHRSDKEAVNSRLSSSGTVGSGSSSASSPTVLSETTYSRKRKRSCVDLERHCDVDDIDMQSSAGIPVHLDTSSSSSAPVPRIPVQAQPSEPPTEMDNDINYVRLPLPDSISPVLPQLQLQPKSTVPRTSKQQENRRRSSQSQAQPRSHSQNQIIPTSPHRPYRSLLPSPSYQTSQTTRRPLTDLVTPVNPETDTSSSNDCMEMVRLKAINAPSHSHPRSTDARTASLNVSNMPPNSNTSVTHHPLSPQTVRSALSDQNTTTVSTSATMTSMTSSEKSSSESSESTTPPLARKPNSGPKRLADSSSSNDGGSGYSMDRTVISAAQPA